MQHCGDFLCFIILYCEQYQTFFIHHKICKLVQFSHENDETTNLHWLWESSNSLINTEESVFSSFNSVESKHDPIRKKENIFDFVQVKKQNKTTTKEWYHLRWMSIVTLVSFPLGTALLDARQMIFCPVSMLEAEM